MERETLLSLLSRSENAILEFKQEWYKIDSENETAAETEKNELIKDILSLANSNSSVAGEMAYLIIGAADKPDENGNRELFDIVLEKPISRDRLLKIINAVCSPRLPDLTFEQISIDEKNLLVITIPPSPYLHETTKKLLTTKRPFDEWSVFIRYGDNIKVASTNERIELAQVKRVRFDEAHNAPPLMFGASVGSVVGVVLVPTIVRRYSKTKEETIASGLVAFVGGGFLGALLGNMFKDYQSIRVDWHRVPIWGKILSVASGVVVALLSWIMMKQIGKKVQSGLQSKKGS